MVPGQYGAEALGAFLARQTPVAREQVAWAAGTMPIEIAYLVTDDVPPPALVTSVRAVVVSGRSVLVVRNPESVHALPGGRREPGETFEETLRREILEETGWAIECPRRLGVAHLRHLGPKPRDYPYPFPDFLWAIHAASAAGTIPALARDDYELEARFVSPDQALTLVDLGSRIFVRAALQPAR